MTHSPLLALGGATGSGKTALAVALAQKYSNLILLSADSRQVYRRLDVGTAKVGVPGVESSLTGSPEPVWYADGIPQYLIDVAEPNTFFSLADYQKQAYRLIMACWHNNKIPFVVGGTGLYIQAVMEGYVLGGTSTADRHSELQDASLDKLQQLATEYGIVLNQSDHHNPRRLIRAIERHESGKSNGPSEPLTSNQAILVLHHPWDMQRDLAPSMVDERLELGLVAETERLLAQGVNKEWLKATGLSYRLVIRMLDGEFAKDQLREAMIHEFRHLMRRQRLWFKRMPNALSRTQEECWNVVEDFIRSQPDDIAAPPQLLAKK